MGTRSEQFEEFQEESMVTYANKVLTDDPFTFSHEDFKEIRANLPDIIAVGLNRLDMSANELSSKLVLLREYAAHEHVDIVLPKDIRAAAASASSQYLAAMDDQPGTAIRESNREGLMRILARGIEKTK